MIEAENLDIDIANIMDMNKDCEILIFEGFKNYNNLKKSKYL